MSDQIEISELEVVNAYYFLELSTSYHKDPNRDKNCLCDLFANFGLKIQQFNSDAYNTIIRRYNRIVDKIRKNKKSKKHKHYDFIPDKLFFRESDFPEFCAKQTSTTR